MGQSVAVFSEFQRIDPFGQIVEIDRAQRPREILSPELPRNAHTVFHVAVTAPEGTSYFLYAGSNPANIVETKIYKESFVETAHGWIPDGLTLLRPPYFGVMPDATARIPGQTTRCYLLDIWVPPDAPVQRVRLEVLLKVGVWFVAPMELRIVAARVPPHGGSGKLMQRPLPDPGERADSPAVECLAEYLMCRPQTWDGGVRNLRDVVRRDAEQDMALARAGGPAAASKLWLLAADGIAEWQRRNPAFPTWRGAEWYLGVRDWLLRNIGQ